MDITRYGVFCLCIGLAAAGGASAGAATIEEMLEAKALTNAYNPVLLDYLLEEGSETLPDEQRKAAIDQLVTALKQDIDISPEEQRAAALATAGAGLAQLFGGSDVGGLGNVAQDATYQVWKGWVDSAFTLQRAGYTDDANGFFEKCIEIYPYSDLRGRCAIGLAAGKPAEAFQRVMALTESNDMESVKAALRLLGELAGSEGISTEQRSQAIARITEFTGGIKKASYGVAACQGLVAAGDPAAVPTLEKLSKGMMNTDFFPCARRGLLLTFDDRSVVPLLEKQLKGGTFSTVEPSERLFAAALLMEAGEASGFAFAEEQLKKKKKKGLGKLMASSDDEVDLRPYLVSALVRVGGDQAVRVLRSASAALEKGSWLETWIAVGLLELGDTSQIQLAKAALSKPEWAFTSVRVAEALAKNGDYSGIPALDALYTSAARGVEPDHGKATMAFLAGQGAAWESSEKAKRQRLVRMRQQIAAALAEIDQPSCVPALTRILDDSEASVRMSAAYGLTDMRTDGAAQALAKAVTVDYGAVDARSRNPIVHAHVAREAARHFGEAPATAGTLGSAAESPFASVTFLALCAMPDPFDTGHPFFRHIRALNDLRAVRPPLRYGRQYFRPVSGDGVAFGISPYLGGVLAYSRVLNDEEVLVVASTSVDHPWTGHVLVDSALHPEGAPFEVLLSNHDTPTPPGAATAGPVGTSIRVELEPMEVQVLARR